MQIQISWLLIWIYTVCQDRACSVQQGLKYGNFGNKNVASDQGLHCLSLIQKYLIRPNYRTYSYKHTVKQFGSLQITASVLFVYLFIQAYVVGTHLNCIDLSMQFKRVPTTYVFIKKIRKKENTIASHKHHLISPLIFV